jgi:hypothetical protein
MPSRILSHRAKLRLSEAAQRHLSRFCIFKNKMTCPPRLTTTISSLFLLLLSFSFFFFVFTFSSFSFSFRNDAGR